jgi:uridylate kinase
VKLTFDEAIVKNLKVMDATALALCRDQKHAAQGVLDLRSRGTQARSDGRRRGTLGAIC